MNSIQKSLLLGLFSASLILTSCNKAVDSVTDSSSSNIQGPGLRTYGLQPMTPDQWADVSVFDATTLKNKYQTSGLTYSGTMPTSYLLSTPDVRDQGQIGSCTGFCGAETEAILQYYKTAAFPLSATGLTLATGITTASGTSYKTPANLFGTTGSLSPLFLYYVERVVIQKQAITADLGANMVNIGQALQGTVSNATGAAALIYNSVPFKGVPTENLYAYPITLNASGYNVASATSTAYLTAPNLAAIANAVNYNLGTQSGSTTNANTVAAGGVTAHGYYVINSTGTTLVNDVKTALVNNKPVMMGFNVYDNTKYTYFEALNKNSYTYNPLTSTGALASGVRLLGGHAVPIVGFINDASQPGGGVFIVENSWGKPWGYNGYFYLPYSVIQSTKVVPAGSLYVAVL